MSRSDGGIFFQSGRSAPLLCPPGDLIRRPHQTRTPESFPFEFRSVDLAFESYNGKNVQLGYFLRVTVAQKMGNFEQKFPLWVRGYEPEPEAKARRPGARWLP